MSFFKKNHNQSEEIHDRIGALPIEEHDLDDGESLVLSKENRCNVVNPLHHLLGAKKEIMTKKTLSAPNFKATMRPFHDSNSISSKTAVSTSTKSAAPLNYLTIASNINEVWTCDRCTFGNKASSIACGACNEGRAPIPSDAWICEVCTLENIKDATRCQACDKARFNGGKNFKTAVEIGEKKSLQNSFQKPSNESNFPKKSAIPSTARETASEDIDADDDDDFGWLPNRQPSSAKKMPGKLKLTPSAKNPERGPQSTESKRKQNKRRIESDDESEHNRKIDARVPNRNTSDKRSSSTTVALPSTSSSRRTLVPVASAPRQPFNSRTTPTTSHNCKFDDDDDDEEWHEGDELIGSSLKSPPVRSSAAAASRKNCPSTSVSSHLRNSLPHRDGGHAVDDCNKYIGRRRDDGSRDVVQSISRGSSMFESTIPEKRARANGALAGAAASDIVASATIAAVTAASATVRPAASALNSRKRPNDSSADENGDSLDIIEMHPGEEMSCGRSHATGRMTAPSIGDNDKGIQTGTGNGTGSRTGTGVGAGIGTDSSAGTGARTGTGVSIGIGIGIGTGAGQDSLLRGRIPHQSKPKRASIDYGYEFEVEDQGYDAFGGYDDDQENGGQDQGEAVTMGSEGDVDDDADDDDDGDDDDNGDDDSAGEQDSDGSEWQQGEEDLEEGGYEDEDNYDYDDDDSKVGGRGHLLSGLSGHSTSKAKVFDLTVDDDEEEYEEEDGRGSTSYGNDGNDYDHEIGDDDEDCELIWSRGKSSGKKSSGSGSGRNSHSSSAGRAQPGGRLDGDDEDAIGDFEDEDAFRRGSLPMMANIQTADIAPSFPDITENFWTVKDVKRQVSGLDFSSFKMVETSRKTQDAMFKKRSTARHKKEEAAAKSSQKKRATNKKKRVAGEGGREGWAKRGRGGRGRQRN